MPSLQNWNPRPAINLWANGKMRRDRSNVIEQKATNAPHFKGIFEKTQDETDSNVEKQSDFKRKF